MKSPYLISLATASSILAGGLTLAATENDPGVSDNEIKIGNTMPYSGPASAWGVIGKSETAYFAMINDQGGVNGRKIKFVSRDDGYSPPKTVEVVRKLVEEDQVLLLFQTLGTASNTVIQEYLTEKNTAAVCRDWRRQVERPKKPSVDNGLAAQLPRGSSYLRAVYHRHRARPQDSRALPK
jgi:hypothetical protein